MFLPLLLLVLAASAGAVVAYGTHSTWAQFPCGISFILWSRQLQWPLAGCSLILCVAVIALVASGKRRAWWLIGLGPVLALFLHRFYTDPLRLFRIVDNPPFVAAEQATFVSEADYVVGLVFNGSAYAYPYACLYPTPVVFQAEHDQRMILMWSAFANRATAFHLTRELYARDVEIVSMPANALLLYNGKLGQFIIAVTGQTPSAARPAGLASPLPVQKMRWREWRALHPDTRVLAPLTQVGTSGMPTAPLLPHFPLPRREDSRPADTRIVFVPTTQPAALPLEGISERPLNTQAGSTPLLVFGDRKIRRVRAFVRRVDDLVPKFRLNTNARRPTAHLIDLDSNSGWNADGRAVDGQMAREGRRLTSLPVDEGLYWGVMKTWLPELIWIEPGEVQ